MGFGRNLEHRAGASFPVTPFLCYNAPARESTRVGGTNVRTAPVRVLLWALAATVLGIGVCQAAVHHIPGEYPTIQSAIYACADGDTILVAPGTYTGPDNRNLDFHGIDLALRSEAGRESTATNSRLARSLCP